MIKVPTFKLPNLRTNILDLPGETRRLSQTKEQDLAAAHLESAAQELSWIALNRSDVGTDTKFACRVAGEQASFEHD